MALTAVANTARALVLLIVVAALLAAEGAAAQQREFAGRVVSVSAQALVVKSRRGDTVTFTRSPDTAVEGSSGWEALAAGDKVLVHWKLGDGTARRVTVLESGPEH